MSDFEDEGTGDVSGFDKPTVPSDIVNALIGLVINTGANSEDQAEEDLDILVDVMGLEHLQNLAEMLSGDTSILVDAILQSPTLREALTEKMNTFVGLLRRIDFEDDGDL